MTKNATPWNKSLGFSDRLVRQLTGCSIDQIPRNTLQQGTVLKVLLVSRSKENDYYLVIADGSYLKASDKPTGNPLDYEIIMVPQY